MRSYDSPGVITPHPISSHGVDENQATTLLFHLAHQKAEFTSVGAVLWSQPSLLCLAEPWVSVW